MQTLRRGEERGRTELGWLDSRHTFSFADYREPAWMGFRALRVINEDRVAPGEGFGMHPHRDMEIVSWVLAGALEHRDSLGNGSVIRPGEAQRMSAGTGIVHGERNPSPDEPVHFLQIWVLPRGRGRPPSYEQRAVPAGRGGLALVASGSGAPGAVRIDQDVELYVARLAPGERARHDLAPGRHAWVQVARGRVELNGTPLRAGDGAALADERAVEVVATAGEDAEALVFDLG